MKRRTIIFLSIAVLLALVVRFFFLHAEGVKKERRWYVEQLNFEFSAKVDSLLHFRKDRGLLFLQITDGEVSKSRERKLNTQLKYNGNLRFMLFVRNKTAIHTTDAGKYVAGDSIRIITRENRIKIYRDKILVSEAEIAKSVSGRPF